MRDKHRLMVDVARWLEDRIRNHTNRKPIYNKFALPRGSVDSILDNMDWNVKECTYEIMIAAGYDNSDAEVEVAVYCPEDFDD